MYLVKDFDQIYSLLLTNFCLYFETDGVPCFEQWYNLFILNFSIRKTKKLPYGCIEMILIYTQNIIGGNDEINWCIQYVIQ
jgi:hypothetical protein